MVLRDNGIRDALLVVESTAVDFRLFVRIQWWGRMYLYLNCSNLPHIKKTWREIWGPARTSRTAIR